MKPILCFGELLIDFLNFHTTEEGGFTLPEFRQYPGGAPANVAAAVGRLSGPARFLGQVGDDRFGHFLIAAMKQMDVDMQFIHVHPQAHTPLAYVFLDDSGDRSFEFLRKHSADVLMTEAQLTDAAFDQIGIFHFCSNTLTDPNIAATTLAAVKKARQQQAIISFDVNLRHNLWPDTQVNAEVIIDLLKWADVIKVSKEEADWIVAQGFPLEQWLQTATAVWITDGGGDIEVITRSVRTKITPPAVKVVDTTAGGDAFSGGLLMALNQLGLDQLDEQSISQVTRFAAACGGVAVSRAGALPSLPQMEDVKAFWQFGDC
ncbi:carbohydrate kinase family protein [Gynuella sunshinyii]|uniref:Sugar kinase, ribokinase family n=1 Tax=Gynuella sunshinyii YC6258 TaxID=1445510 RepID=A0A0C5UZ55_9GAMM|nr:carbohydrate kinase [Gynuella sunshinyii]AJQ92615.1 sugar kinase, ribokinase family [Gynuella sunshinyii YC6258]